MLLMFASQRSAVYFWGLLKTCFCCSEEICWCLLLYWLVVTINCPVGAIFLNKWCQTHGVSIHPQSPSSLGSGFCFFSPAGHSLALTLCTRHQFPALVLRTSSQNQNPQHFFFYFEQPWYARFFSEFPCFPVCRGPWSFYFPAFLHLQHPLFSCLTYSCSSLYLISYLLRLFCPSYFSIFFHVYPSPYFHVSLSILPPPPPPHFLIFQFFSKFTPPSEWVLIFLISRFSSKFTLPIYFPFLLHTCIFFTPLQGFVLATAELAELNVTSIKSNAAFLIRSDSNRYLIRRMWNSTS